MPKSCARASVSLLTQLAEAKNGDVRSKAEKAENPLKSRHNKQHLCIMKKNLFFAMATVFCAILLIGCSSSKAKITVLEDDAEYLADVYGGDDFIQIVPGVYDVEEKMGSLFTTIPLKIVKGKRYPNYVVEEFSLYVTDSNDKQIWVDDKKVEFPAVDKDAAYQKICKASMGDVVMVTFKYTPADSKKLEEIAALITSCNIDLCIEEPDEEEKEEEVVHKNSTDWDKVLDSYENYVNQYIAVLKKVNASDMSVYADMASLMEKYEELANQLENAEDDLTPAQAARYTKITNKLATAAL